MKERIVAVFACSLFPLCRVSNVGYLASPAAFLPSPSGFPTIPIPLPSPLESVIGFARNEAGMRAPLVGIWMEGLLVILAVCFLCTRPAHVLVRLGIDIDSRKSFVVSGVQLGCISPPVTEPQQQMPRRTSRLASIDGQLRP